MIVLAAGYILIVMIGNKTSAEQRDEYRAALENKSRLRDDVDIMLVDAGYIRKSMTDGDIYVPALILLCVNRSEREFNRFQLTASFRRDGRNICTGGLPIYHLAPFEGRRIVLRCIDFIGFGSVATGMRLIKTSVPLDYSVTLTKGDIQVDFLTGVLRFKIIDD